jgi:glutaminyl-tRNA synthetase
MEDPPKKFFRLQPGGEVRLKYAYIIKCERVVKDDSGAVRELHCAADWDSKTGGATAGRKVKGTIHWVSAAHAVEAEVRLYDRLFEVPEPGAGGEDADFKRFLNPNSLRVVTAFGEPSLREAQPGIPYQFERLGYFCVDPQNASLVFTRTITLRDAWAKRVL